MSRFISFLLFFVATATIATTSTIAINDTTTTTNDDAKQEYMRSLYFVHDQADMLRGAKAKEQNKVPWRGLRGSVSSQQPEGDQEGVQVGAQVGTQEAAQVIAQEIAQEIAHVASQEDAPEVVIMEGKDTSAASPKLGTLPDDQDAFTRGGIVANTRPKHHHHQHHHQRVLTDSKAVTPSPPMPPGVVSSQLSLGLTDDTTNPSPCLYNTCYGQTCDHLVDTWTGISCDDLVYVYNCDCSGDR